MSGSAFHQHYSPPTLSANPATYEQNTTPNQTGSDEPMPSLPNKHRRLSDPQLPDLNREKRVSVLETTANAFTATNERLDKVLTSFGSDRDAGITGQEHTVILEWGLALKDLTVKAREELKHITRERKKQQQITQDLEQRLSNLQPRRENRSEDWNTMQPNLEQGTHTVTKTTLETFKQETQAHCEALMRNLATSAATTLDAEKLRLAREQWEREAEQTLQKRLAHQAFEARKKDMLRQEDLERALDRADHMRSLVGNELRDSEASLNSLREEMRKRDGKLEEIHEDMLTVNEQRIDAVNDITTLLAENNRLRDAIRSARAEERRILTEQGLAQPDADNQ